MRPPWERSGTAGLDSARANHSKGIAMGEEADDRERAIRRVKAQRDFKTHIVVYLVVNAVLIGIWAATGAGFFWPVFVIGGWGIGLAFHWWSAFHEARPITEEEIQREMGKRSR